MVLVLDDRPNWWNWPSNVIPVRECNKFRIYYNLIHPSFIIYLDFFFPGVGDINYPSGSSTSEADNMSSGNVEINDDDREIQTLSSLLNRVHKTFFSDSCVEKDVKLIMDNEKRAVLGKTVIGFSGLIPVDCKFEGAYYVKLAEMFGAVCKPISTDASSASTLTHLIANDVTAKVRMINDSNPSVKIVRLNWLLDSIFSFKRQLEASYMLAVSRQKRSPVKKHGKGKLVEQDEDHNVLHTASPNRDLASDSSHDSEYEESSYSLSPVIDNIDISIFDEMEKELDHEMEDSSSNEDNDAFNEEDDDDENRE